MGAALALATACIGLSNVPMEGFLAYKFGVISQKIRVFWKKEVNCLKEAGIVHGRMPRGMHAKPYRPASSRTLKKLARAFFCFCVPKFIP